MSELYEPEVTPEQQSDFMKMVAAQTRLFRARYMLLPSSRKAEHGAHERKVLLEKKEVLLSDVTSTVMTKAEQDAFAQAGAALADSLQTTIDALLRTGIAREDMWTDVPALYEQTITFPIEWQDEGLAELDRLTAEAEAEAETTEGDEATDENRDDDGVL